MTTTGRMVLSPPQDADLTEVHRLHADPAVWRTCHRVGTSTSGAARR